MRDYRNTYMHAINGNFPLAGQLGCELMLNRLNLQDL